ncbi:hypothetical protein E4U54_000898 [Claviceps lovelessii]|nr:hypothetical protein E4U54_000898 [Claviceps lovelessii]
MRGPPVEELVYQRLFPKPKPSDPQNFQAFVERELLIEIRFETEAFYGELDSEEAKYPGLDYMHPTHRYRLSRWTWHRRLFRAFNALGLTRAEICGLTKWEGTKWAKEEFEKEQGRIIRDTTEDEIRDWVPPSADAQIPRAPKISIEVGAEGEEEGEGGRHREQEQQPLLSSPSHLGEGLARDDEGDDDSVQEAEQQAAETAREEGEGEIDNDNDNRDDDDDDDDDDEFESVGVHLNERLRDRATRREAGDTSVVLDEQWEQWLKNAIDSGELALLTEQMTEQMYRRASTTSVMPAALIPPGMLSAARSGQWSEIPEVLHPMLLRTLEAETPSPGSSPRSRVGAGAGAEPRTMFNGLSGSVATTRLTMSEATRPTIRLPSAQGAF